MKTLKTLFSKQYIQNNYDLICLVLEQGFSAFQINELNEISENSHVKIWNDDRHINAVTKALKTKLSAEDYKIYQTRPDLHQLLLIFHMKEAILHSVRAKTQKHEVQQHNDLINYINIEHSITTNSSFSDWLTKSNTVEEKIKHFENLYKESQSILSKDTAFLFLLKHHHKNQNGNRFIDEEIKKSLHNLKDKFALKSILVYPGVCKNTDILKKLKFYEEYLEDAAQKLDIPYKAIGLNLLNVSIFLEDKNINLSLILSKVSGYFFYTADEFNITLRNIHEDQTTLVHEYGHFISSIIYQKTKKRRKNSFNEITKWDNDVKDNVLMLKKAHSLKLDWIAQTLNLCSWEELNKIKKNIPDEDGMRYLENGFICRLLEGIATPSEALLKAPIVLDLGKYGEKYPEYLNDIIKKIDSHKIVQDDTSIPKQNILKALKFFIKESSFASYKHELNNEYLKSLLRLSLFDSYLQYLVSPEEIWARSFEELTETGKNEKIDYKIYQNDEIDFTNLDNAINSLYIPDFHLTSHERLFILYILKNVYEEIMPEINFIPEDNKCYKDFIVNNPDNEYFSDKAKEKQTLFEMAIKFI